MGGAIGTPNIEALFGQYGRKYRWLVTWTSMIGNFATLLTGTIINVAIPNIMGAFGMTQDQAQWLASGYLAATTVAMLLSAWAIENWGMARAFNTSMAVFLVGSLMGGLATSTELLIFSRIVQGLGSGLMMPLSMLIIFQVFPPNRRGWAMGIQSVGMILAPACGPMIGGALVDNFDWRYVFFIAVPFAMFSIPMAMLFMPKREPNAKSPAVDWTGIALLTASISCFLTLASSGPRYGWESDFVAVLALGGVTTMIAFLYWEAYVEDPIFDLKLFKNVRFASANLVGFCIGIGLFGSTYLVPIFLQVVQGLIPTDSGLLLLPAGLLMAVVFPVAGRMADSLAPRYLIIPGIILFAISSILFGNVDANTPFTTMALWAICGRVGLALIFPCLQVATLRPLPPEQLAQGTAMSNFTRQLGGAVGVNVLVIYLQERTSVHVDALNTTQTPGNIGTDMLINQITPLLEGAGVVSQYAYAGSTQVLSAVIYLQGNMLAFRDCFMLIGVIFLCCVWLALLMDNRPPARQ